MQNNFWNKGILVAFSAIILLFAAGFSAWYLGAQNKNDNPDEVYTGQITNFEECVAVGNPVMESYPRQCRHNGQTFVEEISPGLSEEVGGGEGIAPYDSGVKGAVLLGPVCPVVIEPPDPQCDDKPYETTVQVIRIGSPQSSPFATAKTDKEGRFQIMLPPGEYGIQPLGGTVYPRCETVTITVKPKEIQELYLSCDTGIR